MDEFVCLILGATHGRNISHFDRNISKNIGIFLHQDIPAPKTKQIIGGKCVGGLENTHRRLLGAQSILEKHPLC